MVAAIVLAGGQKNDFNNEKRKLIEEASLKIGNCYMIEYVVAALRNSSAIKKIVIAGELTVLNDILQEQSNYLTLVESGRNQIESFLRALTALETVEGQNERILVVTADIPLLTAAAVEDFISICLNQKGELFYPIVEKRVNEAKYPGSVRTYARLKEGIFTGGNMIMIDSAAVNRCIPAAEKLLRYRKSPLRLASYIGVGVLIRFVLGLLTIKELEAKISVLMCLDAVAVVSSFAEIGLDVDKYSDLVVVKKHLTDKQMMSGG